MERLIETQEAARLSSQRRAREATPSQEELPLPTLVICPCCWKAYAGDQGHPDKSQTQCLADHGWSTSDDARNDLLADARLQMRAQYLPVMSAGEVHPAVPKDANGRPTVTEINFASSRLPVGHPREHRSCPSLPTRQKDLIGSFQMRTLMTDEMITAEVVTGLISEYILSLHGLLRVMAECSDLRSIAVSFQFLESVYLLTSKFILLKGERSGTSDGSWKSDAEKAQCSPERNSLEYFKEFVANPDAFPLVGEREWLSDMIKAAARFMK